jgi:hypothetical protein
MKGSNCDILVSVAEDDVVGGEQSYVPVSRRTRGVASRDWATLNSCKWCQPFGDTET